MLLDLRRRSVPINPSRVGNIVSQRCISCAAPTECHRWAWPAQNVLGALTAAHGERRDHLPRGTQGSVAAPRTGRRPAGPSRATASVTPTQISSPGKRSHFDV